MPGTRPGMTNQMVTPISWGGAACRAEPARSMTYGRTASTNAAESRQQMASKVQPGRELPMMM
jgi:hypothetical protein